MRNLILLVIIALFLPAACTRRAEPKPSAVRSNILLLKLSAGPCSGTCPVFDLLLTGRGELIWSAREGDLRQGDFFTQLEGEEWRDIQSLLAALDISTLRENYGPAGPAPEVVDLIVSFGNGQRKDIHDAVGGGTPALKQLYKKLFALRQSRKWEPFDSNGGQNTFKKQGQATLGRWRLTRQELPPAEKQKMPPFDPKATVAFERDFTVRVNGLFGENGQLRWLVSGNHPNALLVLSQLDPKHVLTREEYLIWRVSFPGKNIMEWHGFGSQTRGIHVTFEKE